MLRICHSGLWALLAALSSSPVLAQQSNLADGFIKTYDPFKNLPDVAPSPADPENIAQVRLGNILYAEHCAICHGAALEGAENWEDLEEDGSYPPPPHDDTGHTWHHSDKQLFEYVKLGGEELFKDYPDIVSNMPGFEGVLATDEIWAVFAFIKTSWSAEHLEWQAGTSKLDPLPEEYLPQGSNDREDPQ